MNQSQLFKQYNRVNHNFDTCMACLEEIIFICQKQNNFEIGRKVEECLSKLIPPPQNFN